MFLQNACTFLLIYTVLYLTLTMTFLLTILRILDFTEPEYSPHLFRSAFLLMSVYNVFKFLWVG
jgi:hypothetical protein